MKIDPRFLRDAGREIFTGNELLVKGALETEGGVHPNITESGHAIAYTTIAAVPYTASSSFLPAGSAPSS